MHQHPASRPSHPINNMVNHTVSTMEPFYSMSVTFSDDVPPRSPEDEPSLLLTTETLSYGVGIPHLCGLASAQAHLFPSLWELPFPGASTPQQPTAVIPATSCCTLNIWPSPFRRSFKKRSSADTRCPSTVPRNGSKSALENWLLQRLEEDPTFLPFTNIVALPARRRLPGENPTWHSKTGEFTTQPPRKSGVRRARDAITRFEELTGWRSPAPERSTQTQAPHVGSDVSAHENPSSQDPDSNSPSGVLPGLSANDNCVDPRVLQRNPGPDGLSAFPSSVNTPPPLSMTDQPLESTGPAQPPHNTENQPLAGPVSPSFETGYVNVDDILREFLNFESDGEGNA